MELAYHTKLGEYPQGKTRIFCCCHPEDMEPCFIHIANDLTIWKNCVVYYNPTPDKQWPEEELRADLEQMQLFVFLVTDKFLHTENSARCRELQFALDSHKPVLPVLMDPSLAEEFDRSFENLQYLIPSESQRWDYMQKLKRFLDKVLLDDALTQRIHNSFDARIFLSYRKKDRDYAQKLMRCIHGQPGCRDISIWYDDYLIPGEDFHQGIRQALESSDLVLLLVTPNLLEDGNYVQLHEYPAAVLAGKPIVPVQMLPTDLESLAAHYPNMPYIVDGQDGPMLSQRLLEQLQSLDIAANNEDPEHNYLMAEAYLNGIGVEADRMHTRKLLVKADRWGSVEAMEKIAELFLISQIWPCDYSSSVIYWKKAIRFRRAQYDGAPSEELARKIAGLYLKCAQTEHGLQKYDDSRKTLLEMLDFCTHALGDLQEETAQCYVQLGTMEWLLELYEEAHLHQEQALALRLALTPENPQPGDLAMLKEYYGVAGVHASSAGRKELAMEHYEKELALLEQLAQRTGTVYDSMQLATGYTSMHRSLIEYRGDYAAAMDCLKKALAIKEAIWEETADATMPTHICLTYCNMCLLSLQQDAWEDALEYLLSACAHDPASAVSSLLEPIFQRFEEEEAPEKVDKLYKIIADVLEPMADALSNE